MSNQLIKGYIQSFEVKDIDTKSGTFVQAYTRYDVKDSDGDYGRKGMFTKTWAENFKRIRHLLNHDTDRPVGEPQKFYDDNEYAYMQSQIGKHDLGSDFIKMVDSGLIKEASYGYSIIKANKLKDGSQEILEVKLWEVSSLTGWGANEFTPVIALQKGMDKQSLIKKHLDHYAALDSFCRSSDATDFTLQQLEIEKKHVENFLTQLSTVAEPEEAPLQPQEDESLLPLYLSIQNQILNLSI